MRQNAMLCNVSLLCSVHIYMRTDARRDVYTIFMQKSSYYIWKTNKKNTSYMIYIFCTTCTVFGHGGGAVG